MSNVLVNPTQHVVNVYFAPGDIVTVSTRETYIIDTAAGHISDAAFRRPIDHAAAATKLTVTINDTVLTSRVDTVTNAQQAYAKALCAGKRASLVKHDDTDGDEYNIYLGNLSNGDQVVVAMEYVTLLDDRGVFAISSCVTPRYGAKTLDVSMAAPGSASGGLLSWIGSLCSVKRHAGSAPHASSARGHFAPSLAGVAAGATHIFVDYSSDPAISSVRVLTPGVVVCDAHDAEEHVRPSCLSCTVYENGCAGFALQVNKNPLSRVTVCARVHPSDNTTALLASVLPSPEMLASGTLAAAGSLKGLPVYFVLDCSGSMAGRRIHQVRSAAQFFLRSLPEGTPVELYKFGSNYTALFGSAQPLTDALMPRINAFTASLDADMEGTEVWGVLEAVFKQPGLKNVLFVTDGEVSGVDSVAALCRAHSHDNRVFALGIEVLQSRQLIQAVAEATGGMYEIVLDVNDLSAKATALVRCTQEPFGRSCCVDWGVAPHVRTLDGSRALNMSRRVDFMSIVSSELFNTSTAPITISFLVDGRVVTLTVPRADVRELNINVNLHAAAALKVIEAKLHSSVGCEGMGVGQALQDLRKALGMNATTFGDVKTLALRYNIMVKDVTAFVAVDESGHIVSREKDTHIVCDMSVRRGGAALSSVMLSNVQLMSKRVHRAGGAGDSSNDDDDGDDDPPRRVAGAPAKGYVQCAFTPHAIAQSAPAAAGVDYSSGKAVITDFLAAVRMSGAIELSQRQVDTLFQKGAVDVVMGEVSVMNVALTVLALAFLEKHCHGCVEWTAIEAKARAYVGASVDTYLAVARALVL